MTEQGRVKYRWSPIKDWVEGWQELAMEELEGLAGIWKEQRGRLEHSSELKEFNKRLQRQWAIETGILENLYTLDRGITQLLIERGIKASLIPHGTSDRPVSHVVDLIKDQHEVVKGLFDFVGQTRQLSTSYIKEIHQALTAHQECVEARDPEGRYLQVPLRRGVWKQRPNNPQREDGSVHEYCPPEHVASEMDRLMEMHEDHLEQGVPPEVEAAWFHHRFTQIHPFQDGNGRVARALATLVFLREGWFPLVVVSDEHRERYITALERADHGDLCPLVKLFGQLEKRAFIGALSISNGVMRDRESFKSVIASVGERFKTQKRTLEEERRGVFETAHYLEEKTASRLHELERELCDELQPLKESLKVYVNRSETDSRHWFWNQVVATAKALDYYADLRRFHRWVRLKIVEDRDVEILVSLHPVGTEFAGLMGASAFLEYRSRSADGETKIDGPFPLSDEVFLFSYKEDRLKVRGSYEKWLNRVLLKGLDEWRRHL